MSKSIIDMNLDELQVHLDAYPLHDLPKYATDQQIKLSMNMANLRNPNDMITASKKIAMLSKANVDATMKIRMNPQQTQQPINYNNNSNSNRNVAVNQGQLNPNNNLQIIEQARQSALANIGNMISGMNPFMQGSMQSNIPNLPQINQSGQVTQQKQNSQVNVLENRGKQQSRNRPPSKQINNNINDILSNNSQVQQQNQQQQQMQQSIGQTRQRKTLQQRQSEARNQPPQVNNTKFFQKVQNSGASKSRIRRTFRIQQESSQQQLQQQQNSNVVKQQQQQNKQQENNVEPAKTPVVQRKRNIIDASKSAKNKDIINLQFDGKDIEIKKIKGKSGKQSYKFNDWKNESKEQSLDEIIELYKKYAEQSQNLQKNYNFKQLQTSTTYLERYETQFFFDFFKLCKEIESNDQSQKQQQPEEIDEDATIVDDGLYDQIQNAEQQNNPQKIKPWRQTNEDFMTTYVKNQRIFVTNLIHKGGQGSIYAGLNRKNNKLLVFKEFERQPEYQIEKNIYQKLQKQTGPIQSYIDLEGLDFDDEFYLLIIAKAECSLLDYMRMHQENFIKKQEIHKKMGNKKEKKGAKIQEKWKFHLSDKEFTELMLFQAESMLLLEKEGIYYQDNKPDNILMKKQQMDGKTVYQMKYADFGGVFDQNVTDARCYPTCCTESYYDSELNYKKTGTPYEKIDRIYNEIYTVGRTLQKCLFPDKSKSEFVAAALSKGNVQNFSKQIALQYEQELADIFMKLVHPDYEQRYQSFKSFQMEVKTYYINNFTTSIEQMKNLQKKNLLSQNFFFIDKGSQIKKFNENRTIEFYQKYFGEIVNVNMDMDTIERIFNDFYQSSLLRESIVFLEISIEMLKQKQKKYKDISDTQLSKLYHKVGSTYTKIGELEKSKSVFEQTVNNEKKQFGEKSKQVATTNSFLGDTYRELGQIDQSKQILNSALDILSKQAPNSNEIISTYTNLGKLHMDTKEVEKAKEYFTKAYDISKKVNGNDHLDNAQILIKLGKTNVYLGNYIDAKKQYEQALQLQEGKIGKNCLESGFTLKELAITFQKLRQNQKAQDYFQKSIHIQNTYQGENHIDTVDTILLLGDLMKQLKKIDETKKLYEQCLEITKNHYGDYHARTTVPTNKIADIMYFEQDYREAKEIYEISLNTLEEHYGKEHLELVPSYQKLGLFEVHIDKYRAYKPIEQSLKIQNKYYDENHIECAQSMLYMGDVLGDSFSDDIKKKKEYYGKCLKIYEKFYGENHIEYGDLLVQIGNKYGLMKQFSEGEELIKKGIQIQEKFYDESNNYLIIGSYRKLGNILVQHDKKDKYKEAEGYYKKVLKYIVEKYGKNHKKTANTLRKYGQSLEGQDKDAEGEKYVKVALKIQIGLYGEHHRSVEKTLEDLCRCYRGNRNNHTKKQMIAIHLKQLKCKQKLYGRVCFQISDIVERLKNMYMSYHMMMKFSKMTFLSGKIQGLSGPAAARAAVLQVVSSSNQQAKSMAAQGLWSGATVSQSSAITNMKNQKQPIEKIIEARILLAHYYKKGKEPKDSCTQLKKVLWFYEKYYGEKHRKSKTIRKYIKDLKLKEEEEKKCEPKEYDEEEENDNDDEKKKQENQKKKKKRKDSSSSSSSSSSDSEDQEEIQNAKNDYGIWSEI